MSTVQERQLNSLTHFLLFVNIVKYIFYCMEDMITSGQRNLLRSFKTSNISFGCQE